MTFVILKAKMLKLNTKKRGKNSFPSPASVHAVTIVFVCVVAQCLYDTISVHDGYVWMVYAVEHGCLYGGIVVHVLKHDVFAHLKFMVECPGAHVVTAKTTASAKSIFV